MTSAEPIALADLLAQTHAFQVQGRNDLAALLYEQWLAQGTPQPMAHVALFNLGVIRADMGQREAALTCYRQALEMRPDFLEACLNLGSQLEALERHEEAIAQWTHATSFRHSNDARLRPLVIMAYNNLGRLQEKIRQYAPAEEALRQSLLLNPQQPDALQHWLHLRQRQCKWPVLQALPGLSQHDLLMSFSPLGMLAYTDDPVLQLMASRNFVGRKLALDAIPCTLPAQRKPGRLRIGYLSGDLCMHAVGLLLAEVIESHDRKRFETFAFEYSPQDGSPYRARLLAAFEHVHRVDQLDDAAVAEMIVDADIDVLVDLQGLSSGLRHGILARKPASLIVTYLGFIGPTAMPWVDHVLADRFALPEALEPYFSETPLLLKSAFLPSDHLRTVGEPTTRAEQGLPEDAFVYVSFNNSYKITEEVFSTWMRILKRTPQSCLWLIDDNPWATDNLRQAAQRHGIEAHRLIFSPRVGKEQYLARLKLADLFLDAFPYNAGSTARDAISMGLPLLTLSGKTFVSRMAGSILHHMGLDALVTADLQSYEARAVELGTQASTYQSLRQRLQTRIEKGEDFDAKAFTKGMERLLEHAWKANQKTLATNKAGAIVPTVPLAVRGHPEHLTEDAAPNSLSLISPAQIYLHQIAYSDATWAQVTNGMVPLDNRSNPRPDWQEYWPIRQFLLNETLDEQAYYGFFSPRFPEKTGLDGHRIRQFMSGMTVDHDLAIFSPQPDFGACFVNVYEQNDFLDPGFMTVSQAFLQHIGYDVDLPNLLMDSRHIVFSNFLVARPIFWRAWLDLCEKLYQFCEKGLDSELRQKLLEPTNYKDGVPRKVFVLERMACLMLATQPHWKSRAYDTFKCAWSGLTLSKYPHEVVLSDALKLAAREQGFSEYMQAYAKVRDTFRQG